MARSRKSRSDGIEHAVEDEIVVVRALQGAPESVRSAGSEPGAMDLLAFTSDDGSVRRMAVVIRQATPDGAVVGRYLVGPKIAAGGMATVHLGRLLGPAGFSRTVAIKRLHPQLAADPEFVSRFVDEARIASRVRHANVVPTLDVVQSPHEVLLVLEYVHGESLARLLRIAASRGARCRPSVASAIVVGVLRGLHVAHEAKSPNGTALDLVHRDVTPQNVLVGSDGTPRVLDFGIAKASGREHETLAGQNPRGKLAYMAPEQITGEPLDRRCDVFAAGVILWEALAGERLFRGEDAVSTMEAVFHKAPPRLAGVVPGVEPALDAVLATALAKDPSQRFDSADEMAVALEAALTPGSDREVAEWVHSIAGEVLTARAAEVAAFERGETGERDDADTTTRKRAPVTAPPPPSHPPPASRPQAPSPRDEARTLPTIEVPVPVDIDDDEDADDPPTQMRPPEPLRTPMSMVAPADPLAMSGMSSTRIEPIDARRRVWTPIPMPMPERRPVSIARMAVLVLLPPAIAAAVAMVLLRGPWHDGVVARAGDPTPVAAAAAPPPVVEAPVPAVVLAPSPSATFATATPAAPAPSEAASHTTVAPSRARAPHGPWPHRGPHAAKR